MRRSPLVWFRYNVKHVALVLHLIIPAAASVFILFYLMRSSSFLLVALYVMRPHSSPLEEFLSVVGGYWIQLSGSLWLLSHEVTTKILFVAAALSGRPWIRSFEITNSSRLWSASEIFQFLQGIGSWWLQSYCNPLLPLAFATELQHDIIVNACSASPSLFGDLRALSHSLVMLLVFYQRLP